jgi:hypothetical protein
LEGLGITVYTAVFGAYLEKLGEVYVQALMSSY